MVVVAVDIVDLLIEGGIALRLNVGLQLFDHLFTNDVPTCTIVLDIRIDRSQHTRLFEEGQKVYLCAIASQFHPIDLLLTISIVGIRVILSSTNTMDNHGDDIGTLTRHGTPEIELPEGYELYEVVVVARSGSHHTYRISVGIISYDLFLLRSSTMIVGTILQLPCYTLAQRFFKIGLHTATTGI